jgi:hypothetical protein
MNFREAWVSIKQAVKDQNSVQDIHNELMKKYKSVPKWWFNTVLVVAVALSILNCQLYGDQIQLSIWAALIAMLIPAILLLPMGAITGTTGMVCGRSSLTLTLAL